jgi:hypothetical protein
MMEKDVLRRSRASIFLSPSAMERDASLIAPEMMTMMITSIEMEIISSSRVNPRRPLTLIPPPRRGEGNGWGCPHDCWPSLPVA